MFRKSMAALLTILILTASPWPAMAEEPYRGYSYNAWGESVPSPNGYALEKAIRGEETGAGAFRLPKDMFVLDGREIYVLDSGNNRIVVLDSDFHAVKVIDTFTAQNGKETLKNATGIFVDKDGRIYVADRDNGRVLVMNAGGDIVRTVTKPQSDIFPKDMEFKPEKVIVDSTGTLYVLCAGFYYGALIYDSDGRFLGYYGSNKVETTAQVLSDYFWKRLLTKEQREKMSRFVPAQYSNFDVDRKDFIYTVTMTAANSRDELKKLNPVGMNILKGSIRGTAWNSNNYGDIETAYFEGKKIDTQFVDTEVDNEGFINALDFSRGRIFQYDQDNNLLMVFGNIGSQEGTFKQPVAIESLKGNILVLDEQKGNITAFRLTSFGEAVHKAVKLYSTGMFEESVEPWKEVLRRNSNYELAYAGIGRACLYLERYKEAMAYFKLSADRRAYSDAFKQYRTEWIRAHFSQIAGIILLFLAAAFLAYKRPGPVKRIFPGVRGGGTAGDSPKKLMFPFYTMLHPVEGFEEMRWKKAGSVGVSALILFGFFLSALFEKQLTGFIFNPSRPDRLNILYIGAKTVVLFALWVTVNWSMCTLMDGEGSFKNIWIGSAYALLPFIILSFAVTFLSNFIIHEERIFLTWLAYVGQLWSCWLMVSGLRVIHQYSMGKTIGSIGLTIAGILVVIFLFVLVYSLFQEFYVFVRTVISEIFYRI